MIFKKIIKSFTYSEDIVYIPWDNLWDDDIMPKDRDGEEVIFTGYKNRRDTHIELYQDNCYFCIFKNKGFSKDRKMISIIDSYDLIRTWRKKKTSDLYKVQDSDWKCVFLRAWNFDVIPILPNEKRDYFIIAVGKSSVFHNENEPSINENGEKFWYKEGIQLSHQEN